jgi:curved DNA-binding protein
MPQTRDYYADLGISRSASQKDIQSAFRKLARKLHPDLNPGDQNSERRFKEVSEAHNVLSDPEKRKLYDRFGMDWQAAASAGIDPDQAGPFGAARRPGASYRTVDPRDFENIFSGMGGSGRSSFGDLFGSLFRDRGGSGGAAGQPPEAEAESTIEISLQEAYKGTSRQVVLPEGKRLEVKVPAGVQDGTLLRVPGLRARIHVGKDPLFEREGRDLRVAVPVPLATALLGGEVDVPTLKGSRVKLNVPAETQNGTRLRLRGLGMPDQKGGQTGDLLAEVRVRLPLPADDDLRRWAERARAEEP